MFAVGQLADEIEVGGEEVVVGKRAEGGPTHLVEDAIFELALELLHDEELEVDRGTVAIAMSETSDVTADGGVDAELFVQLAGQGGFRRLACFDLAAGKLPFEAHGLVGAALADEDFTRVGGLFTQYQRGHNVADRGCSGGVWMPLQLANRLFH